MTISALRIR
jgi:hypothetical protein